DMNRDARQKFPYPLFGLLLALDVSVFLVEKTASRNASGQGMDFFYDLATRPWLWIILVIKLSQLRVWTSILRRVDISLAFPLTSLSYPAAMLAAVIVLGETLSWQVWVGGLLITLGAIVMGPSMSEDEHESGGQHADESPGDIAVSAH